MPDPAVYFAQCTNPTVTNGVPQCRTYDPTSGTWKTIEYKYNPAIGDPPTGCPFCGHATASTADTTL